MSDESLQNYIALVVDDHDAVRHALCERIRASFARFELREAGSVDEALKIVDAERVDIVLMDIRLPGMDGITGTRIVLERSPVTVPETLPAGETRIVPFQAGETLDWRLV